MLDASLKSQLQAYLGLLVQPIELVATLGNDPKSAELREMLREIAELSDRIAFREDGQDPRVPSFEIRRVGSDIAVAFAGIPLGHEFTSLVLALLQVGGHPPKVTPEQIAQIQRLDGEFRFETYLSLSCHNCPDVVQALNSMSVLNPRIRHVAIDGALFPEEAEARQIMAVPAVLLNGSLFGAGRMDLDQILAKLDRDATAERAAQIAAKAPFDVLVVGGGPAGAAAAIYAARKGIRTGIVASRFGGQLLDTLGIENFISIKLTEGPKLTAALEAHLREYDIDRIDRQSATRLVPAGPDGWITVQLDNGAALRAKSVILATGARWRTLNVPGEAEYRNRGVAYCPHCDGPLFKGKRVAVIGGGNSGVEAAIDLAGIVRHVTLIEFEGKLRADEVLQRKLRSLPNVTVLVSAQTIEVHGDGSKVTALSYKDRGTGDVYRIELEGVFVQIGLLPNTEWLKGTLELSPRGEIVVDSHGATSLPGVYAAGDATTVPFKQIVIAIGSGATAALAAFEYLMRQSVPSTITAAA